MYNPQYKKYDAVQTNWGQRVSDKLFGTNFTGRADLENRQRDAQAAMQNGYEFQKAVNINKYSWNQQGMVSAGINPLAASGGLSSVSGAQQGPSAGSMDQGGIGEFTEFLGSEIKDLLHELSPSQMIRNVKDLVLAGKMDNNSSSASPSIRKLSVKKKNQPVALLGYSG